MPNNDSSNDNNNMHGKGAEEDYLCKTQPLEIFLFSIFFSFIVFFCLFVELLL